MIELTENAIDVGRVLDLVQTPRAGAVVLFLGTTRQFTQGRETSSLDYECYPAMAHAKLAELELESMQRWELEKVCVIHRIGHLPLEEASIAIAVSAAHRQAAFAAGKWLIDTIKEVVPIWKKENWADGTSQWVHPGVRGSEGEGE